MRRFGEAMAIAAASAAFLSGDTAPPSLEQMAPDARVAIAARYATCDITSVDFDSTDRRVADGRLRNKLGVQVKVSKTAEALRYEKVYAEDDTVMWNEPVRAAAFIDMGKDKNARTEHGLGLPVIEQGPFGTGMKGEGTTGKLAWYPRNDYPAGTQMDVFLANNTMTLDFDAHRRPEAVGFTYCGTLESTANGGQVTDWNPIGHMPDVTSFVLTRECRMATDDGVQFTDECPDWQRVK